MALGDVFAGSTLSQSVAGLNLSGISDSISSINQICEVSLQVMSDWLKAIFEELSAFRDDSEKKQSKPDPTTAAKSSIQTGGLSSIFGNQKLGDIFASWFSSAAKIAGGQGGVGTVAAGLNLASSVGQNVFRPFANTAVKAAGATEGGATATGVSAAMTSIGAISAGATVLVGAFAGLTAAAVALSDTFADVSPQIAGIMAQVEARDIMRGMRLGAATAGSTAELMDAFGDLKDSLEPLIVSVLNGINTYGTQFIRSVIDVIEIGKSIRGTLERWILGNDWAKANDLRRRAEDQLRKNEEKLGATNIQRFFDRVLAGDLHKKRERKVGN